MDVGKSGTGTQSESPGWEVWLWLEGIGLKGVVYGSHTRGHSQSKARRSKLVNDKKSFVGEGAADTA